MSPEDKAPFYDNADDFIASFDSSFQDILYRGHGGAADDNAFMTDYYGHALIYADDNPSNVDAYVYNPSDVMYFKPEVFDEFRRAMNRLDNKEIVQKYNEALANHRFTDYYDKKARSVIKIIRSDKPADEITMNHNVMDPLVPLLQLYAREQGRDIIAFKGGDYDGDQIEFVVGNPSRLVNLRAVYAKAHNL